MVGVSLSGRRSFHWKENIKRKHRLDEVLVRQDACSAVHDRSHRVTVVLAVSIAPSGQGAPLLWHTDNNSARDKSNKPPIPPLGIWFCLDRSQVTTTAQRGLFCLTTCFMCTQLPGVLKSRTPACGVQRNTPPPPQSQIERLKTGRTEQSREL